MVQVPARSISPPLGENFPLRFSWGKILTDGRRIIPRGSRTDGSVFIQEVGPRDGLQNERAILTPETRAPLIERLVDAGLPRVQIGSFVSPPSSPTNG